MDENAIFQMLLGITQSLRPVMTEQLIRAQENPETRFATAIGGEVMIDFDKLFDAVFNPQAFMIPDEDE